MLAGVGADVDISPAEQGPVDVGVVLMVACCKQREADKHSGIRTADCIDTSTLPVDTEAAGTAEVADIAVAADIVEFGEGIAAISAGTGTKAAVGAAFLVDFGNGSVKEQNFGKHF